MESPTWPGPAARDLVARFSECFGLAPQVFRAPGRVNLIGEHTDYNDGFVLPAAVPLATLVAIAPRGDRRARIASLAFEAMVEIDLDDPSPAPHGRWSDYVEGVVVALRRAGQALLGADIMIGGDLPIGAGLSSSASLEVASAFALLSLGGAAIDRVALARLCQSAENDFVGMRCGIMDQLVASCGVSGHVLLIDCRSLAIRPVRLDPSLRLVVCDTMLRHELASSAYNRRREACEEGVAILSRAIPGVRALRDVTPADLAANARLLPEPILRRCRHVVGENARVLETVAALERNDFAACGRLMFQSHESLRDDYEVSAPELDLMVALARRVPGVFGARMTGGGFGGATVSLVEARAVDRFVASVGPAYRAETGITPSIFACAPAAGVGPEPL